MILWDQTIKSKDRAYVLVVNHNHNMENFLDTNKFRKIRTALFLSHQKLIRTFSFALLGEQDAVPVAISLL